MNSLGLFYMNIRKQDTMFGTQTHLTDQGKHYFKMAIKRGNLYAMTNLGCFYCFAKDGWMQSPAGKTLFVNGD